MVREPRHIDWDSAQVQNGTLTVALTGSGSKDWNGRFRGVLAVLNTTTNTSWGEVSLTKKSIKVAEPQPGSEPDLRHFLESIVLQANSDTEHGAPEKSDEEGSEKGQDAQEQMTAAFRSFAGGTSGYDGTA